MNISLNGAQLGGLAFLVLSILYGYEATNITLDFWSEQEAFSARTLPFIISIAGIICASLLIVIPSSKTNWPYLRQLNWRPALALLVLMSTYGAALEPLGFVNATSVFLFAAFSLLGIHRRLAACLVSITVTLVFWGLMHLLGIYLAPGDLPARLLAAISEIA